jgi:hypothetical protein
MGLFGKKKEYKPLEASTVEFRSLNGLNISDDELHHMCDGLPIVTYKNMVNEIIIDGKTPFTNKDFQLIQIRMVGDSPIKKNQQYYISANTNLDIEGQVAIRKTERVDIPIIQSDEEIFSLRRRDISEQPSFRISFQIRKIESQS